VKFDIPGRKEPTKVILYRDSREYVFPMPHTTEDEVEIQLLREYPLVAVVKERVLAPVEPAEDKYKPSRKEV
jgi:hypothetical protein